MHISVHRSTRDTGLIPEDTGHIYINPITDYKRTPVQTGSAGYILIPFASSQEGASNERPYSEVWI